MKIKKNSIATFLIVMICSLFIITLFMPFLNGIIEKYLMYIIFVVCLFLNLIYSKTISKRQMVFFIPLLASITISMSLLISGLGSYLNLINLILILVTAKKMNLSDNNYKIIYYLSLILLIFLWVKSINVWQNFELNLDDSNPNVIAQEIVLVYSIIFTGFNIIQKERKKRILLFIISIITFFSILKCNCRTALIIYTILLITPVTNKIKKIVDKKYSMILTIIIICGLLFPFLYVYLYKNAYNLTLPFVTKKSFFTGREQIWNIAIDSLNYYGIKGYLLGLGSHFETSYGVISNFHNWYLGMVYYFGVPLTFFFFGYLIYELKNINNAIIKISIMSIFLFGFSETSALWAKSQIIILILFVFINYSKKGITYEKK